MPQNSGLSALIGQYAFAPNLTINLGHWLKITRPDGIVLRVLVGGFGASIADVTNIGVANNSNSTLQQGYSDTILISNTSVYNLHNSSKHSLTWHNCYSFGNGVESNRVGDTFNTQRLTPGAKVSTVFEEYEEEHRKYGLIFSGIYNSTSGVNNLNQFVQAEKITKDINPIYGSIQKLHTRDTDLITLCEDKVLKILANKDAVFNADGNPQLTANENVLGQTVPFVGEFGISKNPESFTSEAYRSYFTDKQRGAVMRLSKDGLTPISMHGMKDWFRDNLSTGIVNLLGEYNLDSEDNWDLYSTSNVKIENGVATIGYYNNDIHDSKYGAMAHMRKENILEVGKKYRIGIQTGTHSGLTYETGSTYTNLFLWWSGHYIDLPNTKKDDNWVYKEFTAHDTTLTIAQWQVNGRHDFDVDGSGAIDSSEENLQGYYHPYGGSLQSIQDWVNTERIAAGATDSNNDGVPDGNDYGWKNHLYGGITIINKISLEEVKTEPKIIGSYDDRQDEYNVTIHSTTPKTVSFREDVTGWVSFKSFLPENAVSCANDYYTMKDGKLWQHHVQGVRNNTFYDAYENSSINVILNDQPGSVKSFHTLDYEGSDSRVEGIRTVEVVHIWENFFWFQELEMDSLFGHHNWNVSGNYATGTLQDTERIVEMKQYRNNILIFSGLIALWDHSNPNSGEGRGLGRRTMADGNFSGVSNPGDFQVGDVITTEEQEKTVNHFNSMPKDGWWVSGIETDKQKGSLPEFIEKEGKWFNYIKGIDFDIDERTNFGSFDIQGIGFLKQTITAENAQSYIDSDPAYTTGVYNPIKYGWDWVNNVMEFDNPINTSLQVGDTIYYEESIEGPELIVNGGFDDSSNWTMSSPSAHSFGTPWTIANGQAQAGQGTNYGYMTQDVPGIVEGKTYEITYSVVVAGTGGQLVLANATTVASTLNSDPTDNNVDLIGETEVGTYTLRWVQGPSNVGKIRLWNDDSFEGAIDNVSVKEIITGDAFGFTRLKTSDMVKFGIVTDITQNTITIDESVFGDPPDPRHGAFILFTKNRAVNTSSLLGYYVDVKLENNSKKKVEIFSLSSEVTESSK